MVVNYGLSGFSRCGNTGILMSNREANVGNFLGILDKSGQNFGIFMKNEPIFYKKLEMSP